MPPTTKPTSFRLPQGTTDRLKALAFAGESITAVLLRAIDALEQADSQTPTRTAGDADAGILARLDRIEQRLSALESGPDQRDDDIIRLCAEKDAHGDALTDEQIAIRLGISETTVRRLRKKLGIARSRRR